MEPEYWSSLRRLSTGTAPWNRLSDGWLAEGGRKEEEEEEDSRSKETRNAKANTYTLQPFLWWIYSSLEELLHKYARLADHKEQCWLLVTRLATSKTRL